MNVWMYDGIWTKISFMTHTRYVPLPGHVLRSTPCQEHPPTWCCYKQQEDQPGEVCLYTHDALINIPLPLFILNFFICSFCLSCRAKFLCFCYLFISHMIRLGVFRGCESICFSLFCLFFFLLTVFAFVIILVIFLSVTWSGWESPGAMILFVFVCYVCFSFCSQFFAFVIIFLIFLSFTWLGWGSPGAVRVSVFLCYVYFSFCSLVFVFVIIFVFFLSLTWLGWGSPGAVRLFVFLCYVCFSFCSLFFAFVISTVGALVVVTV